MMERRHTTENTLRRYDGPGGDVTLPAGTTAVGRSAFFHREDVTAVSLPRGTGRVGGSAFAECSALERADGGDILYDGQYAVRNGEYASKQ